MRLSDFSHDIFIWGGVLVCIGIVGFVMARRNRINVEHRDE